MRSTLCSSALHCSICMIGMRTFFKHLMVMPRFSSCRRMTSLVLLGSLAHAYKSVQYTSAGPPMGDQASEQPWVGWK